MRYPAAIVRNTAAFVRNRAGLGAFVLAMGLSSGLAAQAADSERTPRATLVWERAFDAESCISGERLKAALEEQLGYRIFGDDAPLVVRGRVARDAEPPRYRAEVELQDRTGHTLGRRAVEAPGNDCRALEEALVLVVALAVDAQLTAPSPEPGAQHVAESPEPVLPVPSPAPQVQPAKGERARPPRVKVARAPRAGSSYGLVLGAGVGVGIGLMPSAAFDGSLLVGWRTARAWSFELAAVLFPSGRVPTSDGEAEFRAGYAQLRGCAPLWHRTGVLDVCLGLWNGALRARGRGFGEGNFSRLAPLSGASGEVRFAWWFRQRYFARASGGAAVPFVRDRFVVEDLDGERVALHRLEPIIVTAGVQLGVQLR